MNLTDKQACIDRYTSRFEQYGYDPRALGWGKGLQENRFAALTDINPQHEGDVLDVGCGFADLYGYLQTIGWKGRYVGVDIVPALAAEAKKRFPKADIRLCDLLEEPMSDSFDYVFASGVFNAKLNAESNQSFIEAMLEKMFSLCRVGIAVDFMSTLVDFQHKDAYHTDPAAIVSFSEKLSRRYVIRHDYLPYEFCVYYYRRCRIAEGSLYDITYNTTGHSLP